MGSSVTDISKTPSKIPVIMSNNDVAAHTAPLNSPNPHPGLLLLYGTTFLANTRQVPDKHYSFDFGAQFSCARPTTESPQKFGNFHRYLGNPDVDTMPDGLYYVSVYCRLPAFRPNATTPALPLAVTLSTCSERSTLYVFTLTVFTLLCSWRSRRSLPSP